MAEPVVPRAVGILRMCAEVSAQLSSAGAPKGPLLRALVWRGVANERRQAADGVTIGNWHAVVGNRKQTAAIGILLFLIPFSWIDA